MDEDPATHPTPATRRPRPRAPRRLLPLVLAALLVAGCAGVGDSGEPQASTAAARPSTTTTMPATRPTPATLPPPPLPESMTPQVSARTNQFLLSEAQVSADGAGHFRLTGLMANNGAEDRAEVRLRAHFYRGTHIGMATAVVTDWAAHAVVAVTFTSTDDYEEWDQFELRIASER